MPLYAATNFVNVLIELGPPGPPEAVTVDEITETTAQLSWKPGSDNASPLTGYSIQGSTPYTVGWLAVDTGKNQPVGLFFVRNI